MQGFGRTSGTVHQIGSISVSLAGLAFSFDLPLSASYSDAAREADVGSLQISVPFLAFYLAIGLAIA
jgi:hypothetical protein